MWYSAMRKHIQEGLNIFDSVSIVLYLRPLEMNQPEHKIPFPVPHKPIL